MTRGSVLDPASGPCSGTEPRTRELSPARDEPAVNAVSPATRAGAPPKDSACSASWSLPSNTPRRPPEELQQLGEELSGFQLIRQLGEGAFGRVYLARQDGLGDRLVALKVSSEAVGEAQLLAQLLHTNIVPVYSVHTLGRQHIVCMPYLGATTLAHLLREVRQSGLPQSGHYVVSTLQGHGSTRHPVRGAGSSANGPTPPSDLAVVAPEASDGSGSPEPSTRAILDRLCGMTYVEAALWMATQMADGLAHAHERGIIHRDLKPANILLTDEGRPMLLDFNLAQDLKCREAERARLGGTLPYMAPEQLRGLQSGWEGSGVGSDLYALGVILFELLTGRFPFPHHIGRTHEVLVALLEDRSKPPPTLRRWNREITPAIEAIVRHCLEPDPARRYQSARELEEDLDRQLHDLPLRFIPEPSWTERLRKWMRRHPRATSASTVAGLGSVLLLGLAGFAASQRENALRFEAERAVLRLREEAVQAHFLQTGPSADEAREAGRRGERALADFGALGNPEWRRSARVTRLTEERQREAEESVGSLLLVLARAEATRADGLPPGEERTSILHRAWHFNITAAENGAAEQLPRALLSQRAELLLLLGRKDEADVTAKEAERQPARSERDACMTARELITRGRYPEARALLLQATRQAPDDSAAWFLLGRCHEALCNDRDAIACYSVTLGLRPETSAAFFRRGLAYLRQRDFPQAVEDFNRSLELEADNADAHINRALALKGLKRYREAVADLDRAQTLNSACTRIFFIRAQVREQAGDADGARRDREDGLKREPCDELSWVARGVARLPTDPSAALDDFKAALRLNPHSLPALVNAAHLLAGPLERRDEALEFLDRAVAAHPDHVATRASRALLLARLGKREPALDDANRVREASPDSASLFQLAAVHAQTSRTEPADAREAMRLLTLCLRRGYGHELLERSPDLTPLRGLPEYRQLVNAIRILR